MPSANFTAESACRVWALRLDKEIHKSNRALVKAIFEALKCL